MVIPAPSPTRDVIAVAAFAGLMLLATVVTAIALARAVDEPEEPLVGVAGISRVLDVPRDTAATYADRRDFPAPAETERGRRLWREEDVDRWGRENLQRLREQQQR